MFGGWRIVKTMGQRITKLKPVGGFCAETGGAITLFLATRARHSGVDHAHHHRRDRRRRRDAQALRRALGRRAEHRVGVDAHDPVLGVHLGRGVVVCPPADLIHDRGCTDRHAGGVQMTVAASMATLAAFI